VILSRILDQNML